MNQVIYDWTQDMWKTTKKIPSPLELKIERIEMTKFFIKNLLFSQKIQHVLPTGAKPSNQISAHPFIEDEYTATAKDSTNLFGWISALLTNAEYFYLKQFFMWIQLFKYLAFSDISTIARTHFKPFPTWEIISLNTNSLTPPTDVWDIWYMYSSTFSYMQFCDKFLGNFLDISKCTAIQHVDMYQKYRDLSWKQRLRFNFSKLEKELREFTICCILWMHKECDYYTWDLEACDMSCWGGKSLIKMADGTKKEVRSLHEGDFVMSGKNSPQKIVRIVATKASEKVKHMVHMSNDFWITRGHPVWTNSDWFRPDELSPTTPKKISEVDGIYNLVLDGEHTVVVGDKVEWICCTLGKYCGERLEKLHPNQNTKYGPKSKFNQ